MSSSLPSSYHVVARTTALCPITGKPRVTAQSLYAGADLAEAHATYREAIPLAKAASVDAKATVTAYRIVDGTPTPLPGCRFDAAAWRAQLAQRLAPVLSGLATGLQAAGAAVGLGGAA